MTNDSLSEDVLLREEDAAKRRDSLLAVARVQNQDRDRESEADGPAGGQDGGRLGTWRWRISTDTVSWSDELYRALGLDPDPASPGYVEMKKVFARESWYQLARAAEHGTITGESYRIDAKLVLPDGSQRRVLVRGGVGQRAEDGSVSELRGAVFGLRGAGQDIPERQTTTEQQLARSEARFQRLYEANILGIAYGGSNGTFFDGNDEFLRIVGYGREELRAGLVRWDRMTPPEYAEIDARQMALAAERGSCTPYEKEYLRRDGTRVPIQCGYALLPGPGEEYIGFLTDLSARKQAEAALREREQRFRELAETLPELIWVTGTDGWSEYVNERFIEYTGIAASQLSGEARTEIIHPEDREQVMTKWARSVETGEPYVNTLRLRRHDGAYRTFLARSMPICNAEGQIVRWMGTATDVHDQRMAEEALRRTEKLAATGRLAASIAHEINNPLAAVMNSLYLALQMEMSEPARTYLQTAEQELARVAQVTTQTLRFHRQATAAAPADLSEIMESAIAMYASRFRSQGIAVERKYRSRERLLCYGDELRQVFANLLANSLDATRRGGRVAVRIRDSSDWTDSSSGRRGVRVILADTGQGMAPEVRRQMFEPFVSTKESTGTGLGLWVSDGIVRKHGGRITMHSRTQPPSGTAFMLFLPVVPVDLALPGDLEG